MFYNPKVTSLFVLIVFFISSFYVSRVQSSSGILGKGISEATSGYIENEAWQEQRLEEFEKVNWYVQLQRTAPYNFVMLALIVVVFFGAKLKKSPAVRALEYFALLNFLASSLSAQLLVLSDNRFNISATAFGLVYLYYLYNENSETRLVNRIMQLYIPIAVLTILVNLRSDLYTVSPNIVFGNVITEFIYRFDESIQELVGL
jgi:predicted transglutaminase-like protease